MAFWLKNTQFQLTLRLRAKAYTCKSRGVALNTKSSARYQEKHTMINVQTIPKTQPGGVQGALFKLL